MIHSGTNPSNHSAIFAKLNIGEMDLEMENIKPPKRISWDKSTDQAKLNSQSTLAMNLSAVATPECAHCTDVHCTVHTENIEEYTMQILEAVEDAAKDTLASKGGGSGGGRRSIAGWTEFVQPYAEESKFWYSMWLSAGKPPEGALVDAMKQSKNQYKYAVRRLKRAKDHIQNDKFVNRIIKGGSNIFREIKKFRGSGASCSSRIDEEVGSKNISNQVFQTLYQVFQKCYQVFQTFYQVFQNIYQVYQTN